MPRSTVNNALDPLRVLFRRARRRSVIETNPTADLELPGKVRAEPRFAEPEEAAALVAALPEAERALWATAFYAGLRRGELRSIRWKHIDLEDRMVVVLRAWADDEEAGPKSRAGRRRVRIVPQLAALLDAHKATTGRAGDDLVFGRTADKPFEPSTVRARALRAWKDANATQAKRLGRDLKPGEALAPIALHQCRHTAASLMIAAGCNAKALSSVMGHASITITFDLYGHLMKGAETDVGDLLAKHLAAHGNDMGMATT